MTLLLWKEVDGGAAAVWMSQDEQVPGLLCDTRSCNLDQCMGSPSREAQKTFGLWSRIVADAMTSTSMQAERKIAIEEMLPGMNKTSFLTIEQVGTQHSPSSTSRQCDMTATFPASCQDIAKRRPPRRLTSVPQDTTEQKRGLRYSTSAKSSRKQYQGPSTKWL